MLFTAENQIMEIIPMFLDNSNSNTNSLCYISIVLNPWALLLSVPVSRDISEYTGVTPVPLQTSLGLLG